MGINLRGLYILVSEQFLHGADVVAVLDEVGRETVAEGVAADRFGQVDGSCRLLYGPMQVGVIPVMSPDGAAAGVFRAVIGRKDELPAPTPGRHSGIFVKGHGVAVFHQSPRSNHADAAGKPC